MVHRFFNQLCTEWDQKCSDVAFYRFCELFLIANTDMEQVKLKGFERIEQIVVFSLVERKTKFRGAINPKTGPTF